jgi:hypothetical protein
MPAANYKEMTMTKNEIAAADKKTLAAFLAAATGRTKTDLLKLSKADLVTMANDTDAPTSEPTVPTEPETDDAPAVAIRTSGGQGKSRRWGLDSYLRRHARDAYDDKTVEKIIAAIVPADEQDAAREQFKAVWGSVDASL